MPKCKLPSVVLVEVKLFYFLIFHSNDRNPRPLLYDTVVKYWYKTNS